MPQTSSTDPPHRLTDQVRLTLARRRAVAARSAGATGKGARKGSAALRDALGAAGQPRTKSP